MRRWSRVDSHVISMSQSAKRHIILFASEGQQKAGPIRESIFAPGSGSTAPVVQLRAEIKFKGNRRIMEDKFQSQGRGLPTGTGDVLLCGTVWDLIQRNHGQFGKSSWFEFLSIMRSSLWRQSQTGKNTTLTGQDLRQIFSSFYAFVICCFVFSSSIYHCIHFLTYLLKLIFPVSRGLTAMFSFLVFISSYINFSHLWTLNQLIVMSPSWWSLWIIYKHVLYWPVIHSVVTHAYHSAS